MRISSRLWVKLAAVLLGLGLLALILANVDLAQLLDLLGRIGWGFLLVLAAAALIFSADVASWLAVLPALRFTIREWLWLWKLRLVGEMLNVVTPLGGLGGEPAKGLILVKHRGLDARETIASLLVARTSLLLSFLPFLGIACILMQRQPALDAHMVAAIGVGALLFAAGILGFFLVQRLRIASRLASFLHRYRYARGLERVLSETRAVEDEIQRLYVFAPLRFGGALLLAFLGWLLGALELWVISALLGYPLAPAEALVIEATVQLVRQATGLIPGSLGATEGALLLLYGAFVGEPSVGVAVALVRRGRELVWIAAGLAIGYGYLEMRKARPVGLVKASENS
ncbi:MAG TPA: flippase-like domain-containing protein [Hypericibacter adhaerens]|uniref:flippase-like domain-containing protein n=1 Tax=Hypericibacter adhaerens TaxID=2602016 RepID=UPI00177D8731|nr:flippase-like domain-containing protein [Hypericibacter adhaerens]HWA45380.1 flippase-like domain-containing protein [Hypericibacter adhaerens]